MVFNSVCDGDRDRGGGGLKGEGEGGRLRSASQRAGCLSVAVCPQLELGALRTRSVWASKVAPHSRHEGAADV